jgi:hypothetical protein
MSAFSVLLEARDPSLGRFRSYRLEAGTDLFGAWLVEVTYGRIGTAGRRVRYVLGGEEEARQLGTRPADHVVDGRCRLEARPLPCEKPHAGNPNCSSRSSPQPRPSGSLATTSTTF